MAIRKTELKELVDGLPDEIDLEDLMYRLYLREKVARGEADVDSGKTLSADEMRKQAGTWRK